MTNDSEVSDSMRRFSTHGITKDHSLLEPRPTGEIWNYQQIELGFNYRMTDIQAALGISQMQRVDDFVLRRQKIASRYNEELSALTVITPLQGANTKSSYHLYPIRVPEDSSSISQLQLYNALLDNGIGANLHYIPIHRQPYYEKMGFKLGDFPEAEKFHREVISLPMFPSLSQEQQNKVIHLLIEIMN